MTIGLVVEVEYIASRGMWVVTVWESGQWIREDWFHTELVARQWAAEVEAGR